VLFPAHLNLLLETDNGSVPKGGASLRYVVTHTDIPAFRDRFGVELGMIWGMYGELCLRHPMVMRSGLWWCAAKEPIPIRRACARRRGATCALEAARYIVVCDEPPPRLGNGMIDRTSAAAMIAPERLGRRQQLTALRSRDSPRLGFTPRRCLARHPPQAGLASGLVANRRGRLYSLISDQTFG
jgi:hypothetical protein